jgi:hypothetical protein
MSSVLRSLANLEQKVPGAFSSVHRKPVSHIYCSLRVTTFSIDRAIAIGSERLSALNDTDMTTVSGRAIHNSVPLRSMTEFAYKFSKQHAFVNAYRDPLIQLSILPANNFILSEHHKGICPCNWPFFINIPGTLYCVSFHKRTTDTPEIASNILLTVMLLSSQTAFTREGISQCSGPNFNRMN